MKFQGRGLLKAAIRDNAGNYGMQFDFGCLDELKLGLKADTFTHIEKCSGADGIDYRGDKSLDGSISFTFTEFQRKAIAQALRAQFRSLSGDKTGSITGETINATTIVIGDNYRTKRGGASTVVITDSAGSPATVSNTMYTVNADSSITFNNTWAVGALILPLKVAYTYAEANYLSFFTTGTVELAMRFEGLNKANSLSVVTGELYRVILDPTSDFDFLPDEIGKYPMNGTMLIDNSKPVGGVLGQYGRIMDATFV